MANNVSLSYPSSFYHQFFDRNGKPLSGGKLYTYIAGSSTSVVTYKTISGGTESANRNTNPIILDMAGMAELVISTDTAYKFILFDKNNVKIDEWDNVTAGGSEGGGSSNVYVAGTDGEIDVQEESEGLIRRFVISLSDTVKNAIYDLSSSINDIINALYNKKDKQQPVTKLGSATKVPVSIQQNANGVLDVEFDDIAFPDWTTAINDAVANCEKLSNKKNSVTGYESSTTAYPSIKAVVDFVNNILQNLGGKLITDNGEPFSNSNDLPSTTPYQGVNIADKDYAYVQGTGYAERWSASVSGSDVVWVQEYSINIPVFTPAQQAAIDSGATSTKISNYDTHIANTTIHVTATEKNTWNAKQNAISDLSEIRSGAASGATALQPNGNGSNVTSTFTAASSRTNISSGEKLSVIFGKIAKWFSDLKAVAFSGSYSDLSNKPTIGSGTLTIQKNGNSVATFGANQTGNATANIAVPTKTSELTNDSNFLTTSGNGSDVTATFTAAGSRTNIATGEKLSVIFGKVAKWFSDLKTVAFSGSYSDLSNKPTIPAAANNGVLTIKQNGTSKGTFSANQSSNTEINVTDTTYESKSAASGGTALSLVTTGEKYNWNAKQAAIGDLATIRSGAAAGATALQPNGNGSNVTSTFTMADSRANISTGEKLSIMFGKIAKFFNDLKTVAFTGAYSDLSGKPTIGSATLTIQKNGTNVATFGANATSNVTANILVPTKTSELTNDSNFLTTSGNGSNVTSTFTKNSSDTSGMTSGGKLSALFKAISDFFASLKALAFKDKVSDSDISGTISDSHIASASSWNGKQNALPTSGTASGTYAINISGNAATASAAAYANDAAHANNADSAVTSALAAAANKLSSTYGFADVPIYFNSNGTPSRCFSISNRQRLYETITDNATGFAITHNITGSEHAAMYENQPGSYFKYHVKLRNGTISIVYRWSSNWNTILSEAKFNGRIIWSRLTGSSSSNVDVHDIEKYFHDYPTGSDMTIGSFDLSTQQSFQNITAQGLMIIDGYNSGALMLGTRMMLKFDMCFIKSSGQNTSMQAVIDSELYVMGT